MYSSLNATNPFQLNSAKDNINTLIIFCAAKWSYEGRWGSHREIQRKMLLVDIENGGERVMAHEKKGEA